MVKALICKIKYSGLNPDLYIVSSICGRGVKAAAQVLKTCDLVSCQFESDRPHIGLGCSTCSDSYKELA